MNKLFTSFVLFCGLVLSFAVFAEKSSSPKVPESTKADDVNAVFVFNRVCYSQVPNIEAIEAMSRKLGWSPLTERELELSAPAGESDRVLGWDTPIGERAFRVTLVQGALISQMIEAFPDFKQGQSTSCTLVLDGRDKGDNLHEELNSLAGKEPVTKEVSKDGLYTSTLAGGNAEVKVFLIAKTDV